MDYQATLNKSYFGIINQGGPSISENGQQCLYRSPSGRKCGIGQLIPDEQYNKKMDLGYLTGVKSNLEVKNVLFQNGYTDLEFLYDLQQAHDGASMLNFTLGLFFIDIYNANIKDLVKKYDLIVPMGAKKQ